MSEEKNVSKNPEKKVQKKNAKKKNSFLSLIERIGKWFRELRSELKKVTWPTSKQIVNNTWVVLVVMAICAVGIWGFDYVAQLGVKTLIQLVG